MSALLRVIVWITVVALPVVLLLWLQLRFLPYHDPSISGWQRTATVVDLVALWTFWVKIAGKQIKRQLRWGRTRWLSVATRSINAAVGVLLTAMVSLAAFVVLRTPSDRAE
jgi:hypothetical protein